MQIRVTRELHEAVHREAARAGLAASEWIRRLLDEAPIRRRRPPSRSMRYLAVRLGEKLQARVERGAKAAGVTPSEWIRRILSDATGGKR